MKKIIVGFLNTFDIVRNDIPIQTAMEIEERIFMTFESIQLHARCENVLLKKCPNCIHFYKSDLFNLF